MRAISRKAVVPLFELQAKTVPFFIEHNLYLIEQQKDKLWLSDLDFGRHVLKNEQSEPVNSRNITDIICS